MSVLTDSILRRYATEAEASATEARIGAYHRAIGRCHARRDLSRRRADQVRFRDLAARLRRRMWREVFGLTLVNQ